MLKPQASSLRKTLGPVPSGAPAMGEGAHRRERAGVDEGGRQADRDDETGRAEPSVDDQGDGQRDARADGGGGAGREGGDERGAEADHQSGDDRRPDPGQPLADPAER